MILTSRRIYKCGECGYETLKRNDFNKHLTTQKHNINSESMTKLLICENCNKIYKHRSSLWRHKQKCMSYNSIINYDEETDFEDDTINMTDENTFIDKDLIIKLIDENKELKGLLLEQARQTNEIKNIITEMNKNVSETSVSTINNYNNNNSKTFNLNIFLNETCKDAMNLNEFMDSIQLELSDLINVGEVGYIKGISDIITTNLNALNITDRPIHCSDGKREVLYIKEHNKWQKDENKNKIRGLIRNIAIKNQKLILKFKEKYPDCITLDSKYCEQYNRIIIEAMGGDGDDDELKEQKIIKNITKSITLDKRLLSEIM
jgi:hypothetical protein